MSCPDTIVQEASAGELVRRLRSSEHGRLCVPLAASIDFTTRCNLLCRHCFVNSASAGRDEMSMSDVLRVLDELAAREVLFLVVTGGEPLLRSDFRDLYRHAKSAGFVLNLFSNATLIDDAMADFLAAHPPRRLEISVYGHTEETYESVTGVPGSFRRFRKGVEALLRRGLLVRLKTMVMTTNAHEFEQIRNWARELGCDFRYDGLIHGRLNGDREPTRYRLSPAALADLQFSNTADKEEFLRNANGLDAQLPPRQTLFECGAGLMTLHVDAAGCAHPCMLWRSDPYDLLAGSLDERWLAHVHAVRTRPAPAGACCGCSDRALCSYCPPLAAIETGHPSQPAPFYCQLAAERKLRCRPPRVPG